jgi:alpha-galactosidase
MGNPEFDKKRLPNGLRPIGDLAHKLGYRFLVWFEPERVMVNTQLARENPDWVLEGGNFTPEVAYQTAFRLLDYGNPAARTWVTDYLSKMIEENGIDIYRQDFNMYPSFFWNHNEPEDRVGIREIRHVEGLWAVWDALLAKFPKLIIDNCASGGRRLDYELMKRSVPLWRTDYVWGQTEYPRSAQAQTYGLSYWLPMYGEGTTSTALDQFASGFGSAYPMALNWHDPKTLDSAKPLVAALKRIRPALIGDYYPLTEYSTDPNQTIAMQFHDRKADAGVVVAYGAHIDLSKLKPTLSSSSRYRWTDWSNFASKVVAGADVQRSGLAKVANSPATSGRTCVVLEYQPAK